jgi:hypothetical protein
MLLEMQSQAIRLVTEMAPTIPNDDSATTLPILNTF